MIDKIVEIFEKRMFEPYPRWRELMPSDIPDIAQEIQLIVDKEGQQCWDNGVEWCKMHHPETWKSKYEIAEEVLREFLDGNPPLDCSDIGALYEWFNSKKEQ